MSESATAIEQKSTSRSSFARITSALGFAQKPRWIQDFRIELDHKNPTHRYNPGDVLRGTIFFTPTKAVRITHITIALYGYVHVYKSFNAPGNGVPKESLHSDPDRLLGIPGVVPLFAPIEETLFGDVKLQPCRGQFQFALRLPSHRLPSSIDFEKGSIQYNLIASITRPSPINPVIRCDPKRFLVHESIDCGDIPAPKQRVVTLEAVEKKKRRGKKAPSLAIGAEKCGTIVEQEETSSPRSSICASTDGSHHSNESASNSSSSTELRITNITSNSPSNPVSIAGSQHGSNKSAASAPISAPTIVPVISTAMPGPRTQPVKSIFASAEIMRGAFLPGDSIPVRVQVSHVKHIKSMCGLIVTLYRKTHIETEPLVHQKVRDESGNITLKPITGDVYPKSMTGLGGLSMSNKQTSHTFRMDVAQTHVPLFIDPMTHKAEIKTTLKIPIQGVHPTITHVRGDTLDFRYYVEVCLDIQGKLEESRLLPRLTNQAIYGLGKPSSRKSPSVPMSIASQGQQMIDTQTIRRERPQIISWQFHVVIGTKDSSRGIKSSSKPDVRQQVDPWQHVDLRMQAQNSTQGSEASRGSRLGDVQEEPNSEEIRDLGTRGTIIASNSSQMRSSPLNGDHGVRTHAGGRSHRVQSELTSAPAYTPASGLDANEHLDEKTRLRQQEQRLLPSSPDMGDAASSSTLPGPSAPPLEEVVDQGVGRWETEVSVQYRDSGYGSRSRSGSGSQKPYYARRQTHDGITTDNPPVPILSSSHSYTGIESGGAGSATHHVAENDLEFERQQPPEQSNTPDHGGHEPGVGSSTSNVDVLPVVPSVPNDDDHHTAFIGWDAGQDGLPKYENLDK